MNFDDFVAAVRADHAGGPVMTGLNDRKSTPIKTGDIVRFYTDGDLHRPVPFKDATECIDVVCQEPDGKFYGRCYDSNGGALLFRMASSCEIVGNVHANAEPLRRLMRFSNPFYSLLRGS